MSMPDYYAILTLAPGERPAFVESAYRDYSRMLDHGIGLRPRYKMQRQLEAFSVLLEPDRRRSYDNHFLNEPPASGIHAISENPPRPRPLSIQDSDIRPSSAAFRDRLLRNFTRAGVPKAEYEESLTIELRIAPDQEPPAPVRIALPVFEPCRNCSGTGHVNLFPCTLCGATGLIESAEVLEEQIHRGAVVERSLSPFGIENLYLRVQYIAG
jgi:hypothetical protein